MSLAFRRVQRINTNSKKRKLFISCFLDVQKFLGICGYKSVFPTRLKQWGFFSRLNLAKKPTISDNKTKDPRG